MAVEIISRSIFRKVWDWAVINLPTPESAVKKRICSQTCYQLCYVARHDPVCESYIFMQYCLHVRIPCLSCMGKTKAQTSLHKCSVWSAPLFFHSLQIVIFKLPWCMPKTKAQTSLHICAVWSVPLFFHSLQSVILKFPWYNFSIFRLVSVAE